MSGWERMLDSWLALALLCGVFDIATEEVRYIYVSERSHLTQVYEYVRNYWSLEVFLFVRLRIPMYVENE